MSWGSYKSEHNGAKNGGGHWGSREEAKEGSDRSRRRRDKFAEQECLVCGDSHGNLPCPLTAVT
jgi:hypothetical protein